MVRGWKVKTTGAGRGFVKFWRESGVLIWPGRDDCRGVDELRPRLSIDTGHVCTSPVRRHNPHAASGASCPNTDGGLAFAVPRL